MCGITGYVSIDNHENDLIVSLNSLKHRGPDKQSSLKKMDFVLSIHFSK